MKRILFLLLGLVFFSVSAFAEDYNTLMEKADSYIQNNEYEKALASYDLAFTLNPDAPEAILGKAKVYYLQNEYQKAILLLSQIYESMPTSPDMWHLRCLLDIAVNNHEQLSKDIAYAEVCDVDFSQDYPILITAFVASENYGLASKYYLLSGVDIQHIQEELIEVGLLTHTDGNGEYNAATKYAIIAFQSWVNSQQEEDYVVVNGEIDNLSSSYLRYCVDNNIIIDIYSIPKIAYACYMAGKYYQAGICYTVASNMTPESYNYASSSAMSFIAAKDQEKAVMMLKRCIKLRPYAIEPYVYLLDLYQKGDMPSDIYVLIRQGFRYTGDARLNIPLTYIYLNGSKKNYSDILDQFN